MKKEAGIGQQAKHLLKERLIAVQQRKYNKRLEKKTVTYDAWIREKEKQLAEELAGYGKEKLTFRKVPYEAAESYLNVRNIAGEDADIVLFHASGGREAELTQILISDFFIAYPQIAMVYGDEDVLSPDGIRYTPWLKPDWSPDTFLSNFYFGSVFAVRTGTLKELSEEELRAVGSNSFQGSPLEKEGPANARSEGMCHDNEQAWIYRMCHLLAKKAGGFKKRNINGQEDDFPIGHISEILFHSFSNREAELLYNNGILESECIDGKDAEKDKVLISVIIPSKDNEDVLRRCIDSLRRSVRLPYEIILVDNGSEVKMRERIAAYLKELGIAHTYIYEKRPFHFSAMCNRGAALSSGDVCLFLNDDVEVPKNMVESAGTADWMEQLYAQSMKPYAGAVGVKLLYPDSVRVQHGGIANLRLGPVHKLQYKDNNDCYYYGWNRGMRNVIAVTGACLAVSKNKFEQAGGFPEELPVAFNDVDLCFSLYEKGYYNVVMQDVVLYHWESLSRGQDEKTDKLKRLIAEKRKLYERHRRLYGKDPFYHKYLASDMLTADFELKADYEWKEELPYGKITAVHALPESAREDGCVIISLEYAGTLEEWRFGLVPEEWREYYIQGYVFVAGSNNACYESKILLQRADLNGIPYKENENSSFKLFIIKPEMLPRMDVERNLPDQVNVGMTGFAVRLREHDIPEGSYRIGILSRDKCSGQMLYFWTNRYLEAGRAADGEEEECGKKI